MSFVPYAVKEANDRWLSIVGLGEDGLEGLSAAALDLLQAAQLTIGGARHLALAAKAIRGKSMVWPSPLSGIFPILQAWRGRSVCILASGDPFHFGVGSVIAQQIAPCEILCLPHRSSFSLAAARLGWALQETACLTIHGRALEGIARYLQNRAKIFLLSWNDASPLAVAEYLTCRGFANTRMFVLEALGGANERIRAVRAGDFSLTDIAPLNTIALEIKADREALIVPFAPGLPDSAFEHDGQLTKRDMRALALAALAPRLGERLWDVGAGAGSIAIEWLLRHPSLSAIAIERDLERAKRIGRNAVQLGTPDLRIVTAVAPECFDSLPQPDTIFLGGGISNPGTIDACWHRLLSGGRMVAHGVTLQSEAALFEAFQRLGGEMTRHQLWHADEIGRFLGWRGALPVTQWRVIKS